MTYIHFTEEQKYRASCVDLVEFLRRQGEKLIRSGPEYRMASDHSVTVRGNEWYDHASKEGGGPISFVQNYCGLSYPEAVSQRTASSISLGASSPRSRSLPSRYWAYWFPSSAERLSQFSADRMSFASPSPPVRSRAPSA